MIIDRGKTDMLGEKPAPVPLGAPRMNYPGIEPEVSAVRTRRVLCSCPLM